MHTHTHTHTRTHTHHSVVLAFTILGHSTWTWSQTVCTHSWMYMKKATRNYNIIAQTRASLRPIKQHCWQTHVVERWRDVNCSNSHNRIITVPMAPKSFLSHYLMCEFKCEYVMLILCLIHMCTYHVAVPKVPGPTDNHCKDTERLFQCSLTKVSTWSQSTQITALKTINLNSHIPTIHFGLQ